MKINENIRLIAAGYYLDTLSFCSLFVFSMRSMDFRCLDLMSVTLKVR